MKLMSSSTTTTILGVLRRLLCSNTLAAHPKSDVKVGPKMKEEEDSPGLVARLMGLETLPPTNPANYTQVEDRDTNSTSYNNKSRNYCPSLSKNDLHFETPFFFMEHEEFFVISFERQENKEFLTKARRRNRRIGGKLKQRQPEDLDPTNKGEESVDHNKTSQKLICGTGFQEFSEILHPTGNSTQRRKEMTKSINCCKTHSVGGKHRKVFTSSAESMIEGAAHHNDLENSSPVSVLDNVELCFDPREAPESETEEELSFRSSNSRKWLPAELGNYNESPQFKPIIEHKKRKITSDAESRQKDAVLWGDVCKIAQRDMTEPDLLYITAWKLKDVKDIGEEYEQQIIEVLLEELIDQLIDINLV